MSMMMINSLIKENKTKGNQWINKTAIENYEKIAAKWKMGKKIRKSLSNDVANGRWILWIMMKLNLQNENSMIVRNRTKKNIVNIWFYHALEMFIIVQLHQWKNNRKLFHQNNQHTWSYYICNDSKYITKKLRQLLYLNRRHHD